ncbi:MAG: elongation factor 1-beta [Candidatus Methanomethylicota archaeon]|uniref:Elongation factor 1-beta n=1 Tax=Thermoproteota archaeon TaxID=2056631 RepID=A0A497F6T4_9CREN|nr:MAG: elongation factor 1-beta [Candidatus Verstraetearchaeota archaeon]RLE55374.1 MAG: elongation factor 1-beta [Candidatus Verstraetearchaeota archaeon]RLI18336.1 MAG: elongation factor 1-beta [Candidatus Bathyarchaeota archaeon]
MGKVLVIVKVYPKEADVNLEEMAKEIAAALPEGVRIAQTAEEPIAFGLKALKMAIVMPEQSEGGTTIIEEAISSVPSVSQVDVEYVTRMM